MANEKKKKKTEEIKTGDELVRRVLPNQGVQLGQSGPFTDNPWFPSQGSPPPSVAEVS